MHDPIASLNAALAGRYTIDHEIGSGGMAVVYLAHDVRHDRRVALKVLRPELGAVIGAERFLAEIRTTANLQHPGILPLFDSGEADGQLFYVMPYVDGESLAARLDRERQFGVADAIRIAAEVGDALAYAHEHGIVHRDIKPENILVQAGRPVIADFGISLAVQRAAGSRITQTGTSLGTPQYMSPEQAGGERSLDARTDQYSLAVVLFEMLNGEPPFRAPTAQATIVRLMTEDAPLVTSLRKNVPIHVSTAIARALEKLPGDRFATMRDFVHAFSDDVARPGARGAVPTRARWFPVAAALAVATVTGITVGRMGRPANSPANADARVRFPVDLDSGQILVLRCCGHLFDISPDGQRLVFQATDPDKVVRLHVRELDSLRVRSLPGTEGATHLFFSPTGDRVGFFADGAIRFVGLASTTVHPVAQIPKTGFLGGGTWTDDDRLIIAFGDTLFEVHATGGTLKAIAHADTARGESQVAGPHFVRTAQGGVVLYATRRDKADPEIRMLVLRNGTTKRVVTGTTPFYVALAGQLLAARPDGSVHAWAFDPANGDTTGPSREVATGVSLRSPVFLHAEYAVSNNGTMVTVSRTGADSRYSTAVIHLVTDGKDETHPLAFRTSRVVVTNFSADGSRIVAVGLDAQARLASTFTYDPARRVATQLPNLGDVVSADWLGGDTIAVLLRNNDLFLQRTDAKAAVKLGTLNGWSATRYMLASTPWMVFDGNLGGNPSIGVVHRDSGGVARAIGKFTATAEATAISRDNRFIAWGTSEAGRSRTHVALFPSLAQNIVVSGELNVLGQRWDRDGRLFIVDRRGIVTAVTLRTSPVLAVASTVEVARLSADVRGWDVSGGGKRFVYSTDAGSTADPQLIVTANAVRRP